MSRRWLSDMRVAIIAFGCLGYFLFLLFLISETSPTVDEAGHLVSGIEHWYSNNFNFYQVNPPLWRLIVTAPVVAMSAPRSQLAGNLASDPLTRPEFLGGRLYIQHQPFALMYLNVARATNSLFALIGAYLCYSFSKEYFGIYSAYCSLILWLSNPMVISQSIMLTPDLAAAVMGLFSARTFLNMLRSPTYLNVIEAGVALGAAVSTKYTLLVLYPVYLVVSIFERWEWQGFGERIYRVVFAVAISVLVINMVYGWSGWQPVGRYRFKSATLTGVDQPPNSSFGNRFESSVLSSLIIPLPANFLQGIDQQKREFEDKKWSYLRGEHRIGGWFYYYMYAALIKEPLGMLFIALLAIYCVVAYSDNYRTDSNFELVVSLSLVAVIGLVSSQTGFNRYYRYILPSLPFLILSISRVGRAIHFRHFGIAGVSFILLVWAVGSSLSVFPFFHSYFNEAIGGPRYGADHLLDANIDWGQDKMRLQKWIEQHKECLPITIIYNDWFEVSNEHLPLGGPRPGWYAVGVNRIYGYPNDRRGADGFAYFSRLVPVAYIGYSIRIYNISVEDINRLRREDGLEVP